VAVARRRGEDEEDLRALLAHDAVPCGVPKLASYLQITLSRGATAFWHPTR
jgi:Carboxymuconolactone decarboxylase family